MDIRIRPARASDAAGIARVHVASWRSSYRGIVPQNYLDALDERLRADWWSSILRKGESATFVAETMAGILGFASVGKAREWAGPETGELYAIYVLEEHKRAGLGARLFRAGVDELRRRGESGIMLWVLAKNDAARAFYEKHGGRATLTQQDDVGGVLLDEVAYVWATLDDAR